MLKFLTFETFFGFRWLFCLLAKLFEKHCPRAPACGMSILFNMTKGCSGTNLDSVRVRVSGKMWGPYLDRSISSPADLWGLWQGGDIAHSQQGPCRRNAPVPRVSGTGFWNYFSSYPQKNNKSQNFRWFGTSLSKKRDTLFSKNN